MGAQRPRPCRRTWRIADYDALGGVIRVHPLIEGGDRIEYERTVTACAMPHPGYQEQPSAVRFFCAEMRRKVFVEAHRTLGWDEAIRPAVGEQQLAPATEVGIEPRSGHIQLCAPGTHRKRHVLVVVK